MTTLLALIRRPAGDEAALAAFEAGYRTSHLPLIARVPGLRGIDVRRVRRRLMGDDDFVLATAMHFDDWEAAKVALGSPEMAEAGASLEAIGSGLTTLLATEDGSDLAPEGWR
jgi:uncharacterized protein (TIGR02118 family)